MTVNDPWTEEEEPYLMIDRPAWQRIFVMSAGILVNIFLGIIIIFGVAVSFGLPSTQPPEGAVASRLVCTPLTQEDADAVTEDDPQCTGDGPAAASGVQVGDTFTEVDGTEISDPEDLPKAVQAAGADATDVEVGDTTTVPAVVERDDSSVPIDLQVEIVEREGENTGAIGVSVGSGPSEIVDYNPVTAVGGTADFTWYIGKETVNALLDLPERYWPVVQSIFGGERQADSPVSVVGASHAGGQLVEQDQWMSFLLLLSNLNFFLAVFNLVPLPPLDGGHGIVVVWEKIRDALRRRRGLAPGGPVDYVKLMPLTYVATAILLVFGFTVIVADVVNPLRLF